MHDKYQKQDKRQSMNSILPAKLSCALLAVSSRLWTLASSDASPSGRRAPLGARTPP